MYKIIAPLMVGLSALATPVAAGIHDFNPTNVGPTRTTVPSRGIRGNCYRTNDESRVCWHTTDGSNYSAAVFDIDNPSYPASFTINCRTGKWNAWGIMSETQMRVWANSFCESFR